MWIPLTMAGVGSLLLVSGLFVCLQRVDRTIFSNEPIDTVERLGFYAVIAGFALIILANALTYINPTGA